MVFSSILFIFRFLPVALIVYYISPKKLKNLAILILSLFFYSWGEPKYFIIMIISIIIDYLVGNAINKNFENRKFCKVFLAISIFFNLGMLIFFKYSNFFIMNINELLSISIKTLNITLPIGISFYTFQTMSYSIDVYRGNVKAEKNIIDFGAYVALFPQLIAGPIVKYSDISIELKAKNISMEKIEYGIRLFIYGLAKKVLIANNIGVLWNEVLKIGFENISTSLAWLGILAFTIQIYFDFSGYSLMARGLGAMLGFTFPKNFNYPFISKSVSEFWRRWHMTLGSWFKEYIYIPLGGNRKGKIRLCVNLFIVWFLTGFWHGASYNFILWGLYFFIFIWMEKTFLLKYLNQNKVISHIYLLIVTLVSFVFFAIIDLPDILIYLKKMFIISNGVGSQYYLINYCIVLILAILFSTPIINNLYKKYILKNIILDNLILMIIFIASVAYLVDSTYNPFLYFRF